MVRDITPDREVDVLSHTHPDRGVISRTTLQKVTNLEVSTDEVKETFVKFDAEIHRRLKSGNRGYEESKPSPQDWADTLEEDSDFSEEFKRAFNNSDIPEVDDFTPKVLEEKCVDMKIALSIDGEGPNFVLKKRPQDENDIPIGRRHENTMLDTIV